MSVLQDVQCIESVAPIELQTRRHALLDLRLILAMCIHDPHESFFVERGAVPYAVLYCSESRSVVVEYLLECVFHFSHPTCRSET